ncbi:MAG: hypothetical protein HC873_23445 [Leptolyngbyaceae cyanobacterium SL_1_1]|nr:hypothetical protein [Leptolyngbyaceae cyanobacterium SL_1_1]
MGSLHITMLAIAQKIAWSDWTFWFLQDFAGEATGVMMLAPALLVLLRRIPWRESLIDLDPDRLNFFSHLNWPNRRQIWQWGWRSPS